MKAMFLADAKSASGTAYKFAHAYSRDAHAKTKHAPRLRHCHRETSIGMWVVTMDVVSGEEFDDTVQVCNNVRNQNLC